MRIKCSGCNFQPGNAVVAAISTSLGSGFISLYNVTLGLKSPQMILQATVAISGKVNFYVGGSTSCSWCQHNTTFYLQGFEKADLKRTSNITTFYLP